MYLLDVNVLIAVLDPEHIHHRASRNFFTEAQSEGWATCPLTENGFIRICGQYAYSEGKFTPETACEMLTILCRLPVHQFWGDSISLRDKKRFSCLPASKKLTDLYLFGLAISRGGKLAAFDRRINPRELPGGEDAYFLISQT